MKNDFRSHIRINKYGDGVKDESINIMVDCVFTNKRRHVYLVVYISLGSHSSLWLHYLTQNPMYRIL